MNTMPISQKNSTLHSSFNHNICQSIISPSLNHKPTNPIIQNATRANTLPKLPPSLLAAPVNWLGAPVDMLVGEPIADGEVHNVVVLDVAVNVATVPAQIISLKVPLSWRTDFKAYDYGSQRCSRSRSRARLRSRRRSTGYRA
jgi:hypothetical protein